MPCATAIKAMTPRLAQGLIAGLALVAACACFASGPIGPVRSLAEIRHEGVILQKWDLSCGAASLATLFTHDLYDPVAERDVATAMLELSDPIKVRTRGGFSLLDMQRYAQSRGYAADGYGQLDTADLHGLLPAIVPVNFHGFEHFVVVRHMGPDTVLMADPAYGRRSLSIQEFEKAWSTRIAFVVSQR